MSTNDSSDEPAETQGRRPVEINGHCIQYAQTSSLLTVRGTEDMTDDEVISHVKRNRMSYGHMGSLLLTRYNRCPVCESWTMDGGKLRRSLRKCPAVASALARQQN